jgi:ABC-type multidrug transport system permease subunit
MEPEVREFLQRISWSLGLALFWLLINTLLGLKWELAIWNGQHLWGTILFYIWLVVSFFLLLKIYKKWWKSHL